MAAFTRRQYKGAAVSTTITNALNTTDTTVGITSTSGWPSSSGVPFYVVIDPGTSAEEKCSATISGSTLTLTRAQDDTTAKAHSLGATLYPVFTANDADEANELVSKLTTKGDLLVTDGSALNRLVVGTNNYALVADSTATNGVKWAVPTDTTKVALSTVTAKGDLLAASASSTVTRVAVGTNEHRLVADSAQTAGLKYVADTTNYAIGAKGDLLVGTAADTVTNVAVGTNDHVLTADSAQASGVKWAAIPDPGLTLISSTTIGSAVSSVVVSGAFSSTYDNYRVVISGGVASTSLYFSLKMGATTTGYTSSSFYVVAGGAGNEVSSVNGGSFPYAGSGSTDGLNASFDIISPYLAKRTFFSSVHYFQDQGGGGFTGGVLANTTQYTEFTLTTSTGTVTGGTIKVYGYKN